MPNSYYLIIFKQAIMKNYIGLIVMLFLMLTSCDKTECDKTDDKECLNSVEAEFKDLTGLDGCGMLIELSNGDYLEPYNLNTFDIEVVDGKEIWVNYHIIGAVSACMTGDIVEIDCISDR